MKKILRLGTRGSPLALVQAEDVRAKILAANPHLANETRIEIVPIRTSGDWREDQKQRMFLETGDKSLFTKELEVALLNGRADLAVHSLKDLPTDLPAGKSVASARSASRYGALTTMKTVENFRMFAGPSR